MSLKFTGGQLSRLYSAQVNNIAYQSTNGLLTGCEVTASSPVDMDTNIDNGSLFFGVDTATVTATNVTHDSNSTSNDRIDLVVVNSSGSVSIVKGTASNLPMTPDYDPDTYVVLALVTIRSGTSSVVSDDITDARVLNQGGAGGADSSIGRYFETFTSQTSVSVTHNLGDDHPMVQVYDDNGEFIVPDTIDITDENTVDLTFSGSKSGHVIIYGGVGQATSYYTKDFSSNTTWTVNHNLGRQYVSVQCYNGSNELIEPQNVTLNSENQCTVTFGVATAGRVVVVGGSSGANSEYNYEEIKTMQGDITNPPDAGIVALNPSLDFDDSTDELAYFSFKVPENCDTSEDMTVELTYCMSGANSSKDVVLGFDSNSLGDGDDGTPAATESTTSETINVPDTAEEVEKYDSSTLKVPNGNVSSGDIVSCKFYRDADNGSDDASGDFQLLGFRLKYKNSN